MKEKIRKKTKRPQTEDMILQKKTLKMFLKRRKEIPQNTGNGLVGLQVDFRSEKRGSSQEESSECWCFYILEFLYFL